VYWSGSNGPLTKFQLLRNVLLRQTGFLRDVATGVKRVLSHSRGSTVCTQNGMAQPELAVDDTNPSKSRAYANSTVATNYDIIVRDCPTRRDMARPCRVDATVVVGAFCLGCAPQSAQPSCPWYDRRNATAASTISRRISGVALPQRQAPHAGTERTSRESRRLLCQRSWHAEHAHRRFGASLQSTAPLAGFLPPEHRGGLVTRCGPSTDYLPLETFRPAVVLPHYGDYTVACAPGGTTPHVHLRRARRVTAPTWINALHSTSACSARFP